MVTFQLKTDMRSKVKVEKPEQWTEMPDLRACVSEADYTPIMMYVTLKLEGNPDSLAKFIEENGGICVGIACVVDRTRAEAPSPIPIVASALKLDLPNYAPEECPICKEGKLPLVHLGSRKMKEAAKQTL